jgi:hypothetical protein
MGESLLRKVPGMKMVTGFPLDVMHLLDVGVLPALADDIISVARSRRATVFQGLNEYIACEFL